MFSIEDANLFQPESMFASDLWNDKFFMIGLFVALLIMFLSFISGDSKSGNKSNTVNKTVKEVKQPDVQSQETQEVQEPVVETPIIQQSTDDIRSDGTGTIKRVIKTETVIEYDNTSIPADIQVKCPACGTTITGKEGMSIQCPSCCYQVEMKKG